MPLADVIREISYKWNLASGRLTPTRAPVAVTRGEQVSFVLRLARGTTPVELPDGTSLRGTLRLRGKFDATELLQFAGFEAVGDPADGVYAAIATISGDPIDEALEIDGDDTNDLDQLVCFLTFAVLEGTDVVSQSNRGKVTLFSGDVEGANGALLTQGGDFLITQAGDNLAFQ